MKKLLDAYNAAFFHPTNPGDVIWKQTQAIIKKIQVHNRMHPMGVCLLSKADAERWLFLASD